MYGEKLDVYTNTAAGRQWEMVQEEVALEKCGKPCSVREAANGTLRLVSTQQVPPTAQLPETIQEVLEDEWGNGWLWKSLWMTGMDEWLVEAIGNGTLVAVTDGHISVKFTQNYGLCSFCAGMRSDWRKDGGVLS